MNSSQKRAQLETALRRDISTTIEGVLTELAGRADIYGSVPAEAMSGDIAATVERNLRLFAEVMSSGTLPTAEHLAEIRHSAARRAEERVPLDVMLRAYLVGTRCVFDRTLASADLEVSGDDVREITTLVLDYLSEVVSVSSVGYLEEHQMIVGAAQTDEQRTLDALLHSDLARLDTELSHVDVPAEFDVGVLDIEVPLDSGHGGVDEAIAARRTLRRVRSALRTLAPNALLSSLTPDGGIALLPAGIGDSVIVDAVSVATGTPGRIAFATAVRSEVAHAVSEAHDVADITRLVRASPGAYRLVDVVVEYQITRPGTARRALANTVAPIERDDQLMSTLRRFLEHGGNRRRVALDENVHTNTVDYRMTKVTRLTGHDPTTATGAFRLRTALIAHDAEQAGLGT